MVSDASHILTTTKAPGPDGLWGCVMKTCTDRLGPVFTRFFQLLLNTQCTIVSVAKKYGIRQFNDF